MRLLRVGEPGRERPAVLDGDLLRDASAVVPEVDGDFLADGGALRRTAAALEAGSLPVLDGAVRIGAPVARPGKVVGIGLNYRDHAAEAGVDPPAEPVVFLKAPTSVCGPFDDIVMPPGSTHTDWEVELGVVVGRRLRRCDDPDVALGTVAGYVAAQDVSERDLQLHHGPTWTKGKSYDTFCPLGPWLATPDEVGDPDALGLQLWVNGRLRQSSHTKEMVFGVGELLAYVSGLMTLEPGDVVLTGTPGGVAMGRPEPKPYLRSGDVVEVEVERLGRQRNVVREG